MVKYNAKVFLAKAEHYLNLEPTDLVQAGEKIWGAVIFALKKPYLAIQVDVASHAANRALFKLAARVFDSKTQGDLYDVWSLVEKCHENFYGQALPRTDILEALEGAKLAVRKLESMNMQILRRKFFEERAQPKDLSKFGSEDYQKPYSKVHGGITYYVKVKCY
uniref:Uncharacterized protein n=1 Tax=Ditylenchus dipsaci TaxID=166011 RepID=A0A915EIL8_9BILA